MSFHDEPFTPEEVDEQIEHLSHLPSSHERSADASTQLVHELQALAKEDEARLQRIRTRLAESHSARVIASGAIGENTSTSAVSNQKEQNDQETLSIPQKLFVERSARLHRNKRRLVTVVASLRVIVSGVITSTPVASSQDDQDNLETFPIPQLSVERSARSHKHKRRLVTALASLVALLIIVSTAVFSTRLATLNIPGITILGAAGSSGQPAQRTPTPTPPATVSGSGIAYPNQSLNISYPLSERALAVNVRIGDHVTTNQALIKLDPTQSNQALTDAQNQVTAAQQYLASVQATGNATTIAQANENLAMAQNKYNALQAQNRNGNLVSPMNGVVTAVNVQANEIFAANTTLVTIVDESRVTVYAKIPLRALSWVQVGQRATVSPSAFHNVQLHGTVISVVPVIDPRTDMFEALVQVQNPKQGDTPLLPGMQAFVTIQVR